jgi:nucleoside-diphosphate-sugar epimerase
MKILLIGGAGYLGIPLTSQLKLKNHNVTVYDKFLYTNETFISNLVGGNNIDIIKDDIENIHNYEDKLNSFDYVYYLASPRLGELTHNFQVDKELFNFKKVIDLIKNENLKFTFISSCSVYGNNPNSVDEDSPINITSLYSELKIKCENILLEKNNPNFKIFRLSTLYGDSKYIRNDLFINNIVSDIKNNKDEIKIYGPNSIRPYLHVSDCANLLSILCEIDFEYVILNIGNDGLNINKNELINIVKDINKKYYNMNINVRYENSEDVRNYNVNFLKISNIIFNYNFKSYFDGIEELFLSKKIICALEPWDSILNYYRPNGSSKTWYIEEEGWVDIPKSLGIWNIVNIEDNYKMFDNFNNVITPNFNNSLSYYEIDKPNTKYLYPIFIYDSSFFKTNKDLGFKCISKHYIDDIRMGLAKLVLILTFEGYSGMIGNSDLEILNNWILESDIPSENVYYISGNLIIDNITKNKGYNFKSIPLSTFEPWIFIIDIIKRKHSVKFNPIDTKYLCLSYNRNPRYHRIYLMSYFIKFNIMENSLISMSKFDYNPTSEVDEILPISKLWELTPIVINKDLNINWASDIEVGDYEKTFISVVTETLIDNDTLFISEKTWKPILIGHPFIILGNPYTLKYLKEIGFKTFDKWIDESYDNMENVNDRMIHITKELCKFKEKSIDELKIIREEMYEICEYNKNYFIKLLEKKYNFKIDVDGNICGDVDNNLPILNELIKIWETF